MIAARPDPEDEHPRSADVAASCFGALADRRSTMRAGAVVTDVCMGDGGDAIRVDVEHAEGQALTALLPYTKKRLSKRSSSGSCAPKPINDRSGPDPPRSVTKLRQSLPRLLVNP
jgi:hypothetical protein